MRVATRVKIGEERFFMGKGVKEMLEAIDKYHSIKRACEATSISYPKALRILKNLEKGLGFPVVVSVKGGSHHGGTQLTEKGKNVLKRYDEIVSEVSAFAQKLVAERFIFD